MEEYGKKNLEKAKEYRSDILEERRVSFLMKFQISIDVTVID